LYVKQNLNEKDKASTRSHPLPSAVGEHARADAPGLLAVTPLLIM
jgi:hypothetical protein